MVLEQFDPYKQPKREWPILIRHILPLAIHENLNDPPQYVLEKQTRSLQDYKAILPVGHRLELDALSFLTEMKRNTTNTLQHELGWRNGLKFEQILAAEFEKQDLSVDQLLPDTITTVAYFHSSQKPILHVGKIEAGHDDAAVHISEEIRKFTNLGFGWNLKRCIALDLALISPYEPEATSQPQSMSLHEQSSYMAFNRKLCRR